MFITDSIDDTLSVASLSVEAINSNIINKLSDRRKRDILQQSLGDNKRQQVAFLIDDDRLKGAPSCTGTPEELLTPDTVPVLQQTVLREVTRHRRGEATGGKNLAWHSGHETKKS